MKFQARSSKEPHNQGESIYHSRKDKIKSTLFQMGGVESRHAKRPVRKHFSLDESKFSHTGSYFGEKGQQMGIQNRHGLRHSRSSMTKDRMVATMKVSASDSLTGSRRSDSLQSGAGTLGFKLPKIPEIRIEDIHTGQDRRVQDDELVKSGIPVQDSLDSFRSSEPSRPATGNEADMENAQQRRVRFDGGEVSHSARISEKRMSRRRKRRKSLGNKWKRLARFFCVLYRTWKLHSNRVTDILDQFDSLDMIMNQKDAKQDLLFDLSDYRAHKEAKITQEAKRVLCLRPGMRNEKDLHCIRVALRNYPSMIEYPVRMQRMMAERAWYECYDSKRVILREGHLPLNFYFILSGSVLVSRYDHDKKANKTICFLSRGDSFGEQAIMDKVPRDCTVITKERVELFCISDEDYKDIFMSGGLNNPNDPFLKSISCLRGWPRHHLSNNPKTATLAFYRRKTVLEQDSTQSDWIFIVKSGSANVMKKLQHVDPTGSKQVKKKKKVDPDEGLSHEEMLEKRLKVAVQVRESKQTLMTQLAMPELNIATLPSYKSRKDLDEQGHRKLSYQHGLASRLSLTTPTLTPTPRSPTFPMQPAYEDLFKENSSSQIKGDGRSSSPFLTKGPMPRNPPVSITVTTDDMPPRRMSLIPASPPPVLPALPESSPEPSPREQSASQKKQEKLDEEEETQPMFVVVQTLTKGSVFGLADIVYGSQPVFSLVSNGAEIIKINKKFYIDHADQRVMTRLREEIYPYPTDDDMQDMLQTCIDWDYNRTHCLLDTLQKLKIQQSNIHDARMDLNPRVSALS